MNKCKIDKLTKEAELMKNRQTLENNEAEIQPFIDYAYQRCLDWVGNYQDEFTTLLKLNYMKRSVKDKLDRFFKGQVVIFDSENEKKLFVSCLESVAGSYLREKYDLDMEVWPGFCCVHNDITLEHVANARKNILMRN